MLISWAELKFFDCRTHFIQDKDKTGKSLTWPVSSCVFEALLCVKTGKTGNPCGLWLDCGNYHFRYLSMLSELESFISIRLKTKPFFLLKYFYSFNSIELRSLVSMETSTIYPCSKRVRDRKFVRARDQGVRFEMMWHRNVRIHTHEISPT